MSALELRTKHPRFTATVKATDLDAKFSVTRRSAQAMRSRWIATCAARIRSLRPEHEKAALDLLAAEMWMEVGAFDPCIAAEMECESWPSEH